MSDSGDEFEPFDLDEHEIEQPPQRPAAQATQARLLRCESCGANNEAANQHCEACGARLIGGPLPVAPQPMLRTTAGARALMVLGGILIVVLALSLIVTVFSADPTTPQAGPGTVAPPPTTVASIVELKPVRVECTSQLESFPCSALSDSDPNNRWNAADGGIGESVTFFFSPPVQIAEMYVHNVDDEEPFIRNARIKGLEIVIDDNTQAKVVELNDSQTPQQIQLRSLRTSTLTMTITRAYPGTSYEGREPFRELALQEITFLGRVAPSVDG